MMTLQEEVIALLKELSAEDLQKVLHFVETLSAPVSAEGQRKSLRGLFAQRGIDITAEDISEARKEAWANFPRDISLD